SISTASLGAGEALGSNAGIGITYSTATSKLLVAYGRNGSGDTRATVRNQALTAAGAPATVLAGFHGACASLDYDPDFSSTSRIRIWASPAPAGNHSMQTDPFASTTLTADSKQTTIRNHSVQSRPVSYNGYQYVRLARSDTGGTHWTATSLLCSI